MQKIKNYFNGFSYFKWLAFVGLTLLVLAALEQQVSRLYWEYGDLIFPRSEDFNPVVFHGKLKILNTDRMVKPGEPLIWQANYDKNQLLIPEITCQLFNHVVWTVTVEQPTLKPMGKNKVEIYPLHIPRGADYGWWTMKRSYTYLVGPYKRPISVTVESEPFYVVASIPSRGPKGDKGVPGKQGITGERGEKGKNFWGRRE